MGWSILLPTVKILASLRLTITIFLLLPHEIFFSVNFFYDLRLKFISFYALGLTVNPLRSYIS